MPTRPRFFDLKPLVIAALHLPELGIAHQPVPMSWLEEYVIKNLSVFVSGGISAIILQEETLTTGPACTESVAILSALARTATREYPDIHLGIIVQAHDPIAPIAIAHASGASFVRIKVFAGAMLKAEGIQQGIGVAARDYRTMLNREDIQIIADVHDRTGFPLTNEPIHVVANWAAQSGADALILTGSTLDDSIDRVRTVREAGVSAPLLVGGGADASNVVKILNHAQGLVVSSTLKRDDPDPNDLVRWDKDKICRFVEAARSVSTEATL